MRRLPSSASSSDSAISKRSARGKRVLNDYTLAKDLDRQFGDVPVGLREILLSMIHGFAGNPRGQLHLHHLEARPGIRSSRCPIRRPLTRPVIRRTVLTTGSVLPAGAAPG